MNVVRTITRFVPRWGLTYAPCAQEVSIHLFGTPDGWYGIQSPWACLAAPNGLETTDAQLAAIVRPACETAAEAEEHAKRSAPYWTCPHNETVRDRISDAIRWDGELVGAGNLADALDLTREQLYAVGRGETKATRKHAAAAQNYHGRRI